MRLPWAKTHLAELFVCGHQWRGKSVWHGRAIARYTTGKYDASLADVHHIFRELADGHNRNNALYLKQNIETNLSYKVVAGKIAPSVHPLQLVLISDPGQDLDDEMAFIMLRHLQDMEMVEVKGIITTLCPAFDRARLARGTLDLLGLFHVPIGIGTNGGDSTGEHKASTFERWANSYMPTPTSESCISLEPGRRLLSRLYTQAEPKSITMVIIASLKDAALFLRDDTALFVEKTREVVIMGGVEAFDQEKHETVLVPDSAHNNMFDKQAAQFFYKRCQQLHVKIVVVSRWAAYAAKVPRSCYDELAALGSPIGCRLRNAQRTSLDELWRRACSHGARRGSLPPRCDRNWFMDTFCAGKDEPTRGSEDTIWDLVVGVMQYDTVAVLCAIPEFRARYFTPTVVSGIGGVEHMVIGVTQKDHGVSDSLGLRELMRKGFKNGLAHEAPRRARM